MRPRSFLLISFSLWINATHSKCIWYEGIRDGYNQDYLNGDAKPLPVEDIALLNDMCPHVTTREGRFLPFSLTNERSTLSLSSGTPTNLCCDRRQLLEMQRFKYLLDNLIGRCPSCYYNLLRIFCEMACSPEQDQFLWPLEYINITRPSEQSAVATDQNDPNVRQEWALDDYVDPDEEGEETGGVARAPVTPKPVDMVTVVRKIRYFLSEKQANDFIDSCW